MLLTVCPQCQNKTCKKLEFMSEEHNIPTDSVQHLLDMAEEILGNRFFRQVERTNSQSTPKKRRRTQDSSSAPSSPPTHTSPSKKLRIEEGTSSTPETKENTSNDPPLTAEQLQSGELLDMTLPVPIRVLISVHDISSISYSSVCILIQSKSENRIHYEVIFPRCDGLYVRFDDWKLLLGTLGLEMGTRFEVLNHGTKKFERSEWSKRHVVKRGTHGLSVFVPMVW